MTDPLPLPPKVPGLTGLTVMARGGYATIYRAEQESVGREVAVKVENRTLENDRDRRRFLREARAAGRMSGHPHVVDLFDAGVTVDDHPYLIMELCEGSYLERMRTSPLGAPEAREVGIKIADALADAHALGVLHRDVKPANILYSRFGEPALADFGLAILVESRDVSITLDTLTPAYAPPEMFRAAPPSPAGDVYALCATLYALMRGKPPRWHEVRNPSLVSLVDMFHQPIPDLPGVPPDLMRLLRAGMANDERHRPSAQQLRDALESLRIDPGPSSPVLIPPLGSPSVHPAAYRTPADRRAQPAPWDPQPGTGDDNDNDNDDTVRHGTGDPSVGRPDGVAESATRTALPARRSIRPLWWALAAGSLALAAVIALLVASVPKRSSNFITPSGDTRAAASPCGLALDSSIGCPQESECYDDVTVQDNVARARKLDCNAHHKWEVFALGTLPAEVKTVDFKVVDKHPTVDRVCSPTTLLSVVGSMEVATWQLKVLPPTPEDLRKGDRTYRCLAGSGETLTSPRFKFPR